MLALGENASLQTLPKQKSHVERRKNDKFFGRIDKVLKLGRLLSKSIGR